MEKHLRKIYCFAKGIIVPNLRYSQELFRDTLESVVIEGNRWLDLGCGHRLLPEWEFEEEKALTGRAASLVGIDYDRPSLEKHRSIRKLVQGSVSELPFESNYFDLATANMVVEHLDEPHIQFREIGRALAPGGIFVFHTPNAKGYFSLLRKLIPDGLAVRLARILDGREADDVFKTYYRANTESSIIALAEETGFEVVKIKLINSDATFALVTPVAIFELVWLRILMSKAMRTWRTNIIAILRKKGP